MRVEPAGDGSIAGEPYRVSFLLPNYGSVPVAAGNLGPDGRITLEKIAPSGKEPFDREYTVEVAGLDLGRFAVKDEPGRQTFSFRMPPRRGSHTGERG